MSLFPQWQRPDPTRPGGVVAPDGRCADCGAQVPVGATVVRPGPGYEGPADGDAISAALADPHRLLEPLP